VYAVQVELIVLYFKCEVVLGGCTRGTGGVNMPGACSAQERVCELRKGMQKRQQGQGGLWEGRVRCNTANACVCLVVCMCGEESFSSFLGFSTGNP
jgi:hypothetical protein